MQKFEQHAMMLEHTMFILHNGIFPDMRIHQNAKLGAHHAHVVTQLQVLPSMLKAKQLNLKRVLEHQVSAALHAMILIPRIIHTR